MRAVVLVGDAGLARRDQLMLGGDLPGERSSTCSCPLVTRSKTVLPMSRAGTE
jgi:hypothetical protein